MRSRPRVRKARAALAATVRPTAVALAALTLVATGAWAAWARVVPYVARHDYFRLRTIRVSSDETRVPPQTLAEIAGLYDDASLWDVDPDNIRQTLRDASWVRQANVSRHFPWQVNLSVSRRYAVAAAVAGNKAFLVDREGVLFHEVEETAVPDLPYLTGWDAAPAQAEKAARLRALLGVLGEANTRQVEVSELHMGEDDAVWLYATGIKASVRLGNPDNAATGLDRLAIALAELGPLSDRARVIDTDYPDRIVIRGADDKLPALLAAHTEKAATRDDARESSVARGVQPAGTLPGASASAAGTAAEDTGAVGASPAPRQPNTQKAARRG